MSGCWEGATQGVLVEEHWMQPRAGTMLGIGRTSEDGVTIAHESMIIRTRGEQIVFTAHPSGQVASTDFVATESTDSSATFSNPQHDFPQQIEYRRVGLDSLHARIHGRVGGRPHAMAFPMGRAPCTAAGLREKQRGAE
jgi:hypothetical protein